MDLCVVYAYYLIVRKIRRRRWNCSSIKLCATCIWCISMSVTLFDELAVKCQSAIEWKKDLVQGIAFSIQEMLAIIPRQGKNSYVRIGITTASKIVPNTRRVLWIALKSIVFSQFSKEFWHEIAEGFKKTAHFPHCLGAVNGKHVLIINPEHSGSLYYNYKHFFTAADQTIPYDSTLIKALADGSLDIPQPDALSPELRPLPYVFAGDEASGISVYFLRPCPRTRLKIKQKSFNYRLSTARRYFDCAFGILTNKWHIFTRLINLNRDNSHVHRTTLYEIGTVFNSMIHLTMSGCTTFARNKTVPPQHEDGKMCMYTGMSLPRTSPAV
ncbi:hypothetical protein PR048_006899 [Dryococelus australis]|uniref:DDE Tnp4 domain-containing protein n=1 Tax=Dryococelus australis TaxID=614101 RepID=A0ABQ9IC77_9NEOP|nr:hypothetical protein PR048_006899 [Dryococelus australis]